jgi:hypothetical protein
MYQQSLYKVLDNHIKPKIIKKNNRYKKWEYGYNIEHDVVVISKTGEIGEIYEIQNLKIALPKEKNTHKFESNRFEYKPIPKELQRIKTIFDWEEYSLDFKEKWYDYIDEEFNRREQGFWFYNKDVPTYITGTHYMYLQWSKIDVGKPDFREANRLFFLFWEVWTGQRPSSPTVSQPVNLPDVNLPPTKPYRNYRDWTPQSTGRTRGITPTMGRNSNSSSMMNRGSGKNPTTSSTTGGSRRQH